MSRDKKKFLSRCPFVPGQGQEQMSRDKLLCPVPGQNNLPKRTKKQEKDVPKQEKDIPKQEKDVPKQEKDVLKQEKDVLKQKRMFRNRKRCSETGNHRKKFHFINVFSFVSVPRDVLGRDGTSCQNPVPSRGKILSLSRCPFVPGQGRNFCPDVPKSCAVPSRWKP